MYIKRYGRCCISAKQEISYFVGKVIYHFLTVIHSRSFYYTQKAESQIHRVSEFCPSDFWAHFYSTEDHPCEVILSVPLFCVLC